MTMPPGAGWCLLPHRPGGNARSGLCFAGSFLPGQPQAKARRGDAEAGPRIHVNRCGVIRPVSVEVVVMSVVVMAVAVVMMVAMMMTMMTMSVTVTGSRLGLRCGKNQSDDGHGSQQETLHLISPRFDRLGLGGPGDCLARNASS